MKTGHIRIGIDKKVYFEPDGLPKPVKENYSGKTMPYFDEYGYHEAMKAYEASKRLIEVSNVFERKHKIYFPKHWIFTANNINLDSKIVIDGQSCKAEVTDKATIIELN